MASAAAQTQENNSWIEIPPGMKGPVAFSAAFHIALVVVALIGLPYFKKETDTKPVAIPIEILPVGEMTTTNKIPMKAKPVEEPVEAKPIVKEKPPAPPKVETVEPPKEITPPKPKAVTKPKPKPVAPPPPTEKLEKPQEKPKPEEKPVEETQQQDFESLLKNLQDSEPVVQDQTLPESKDATPVAAPDAPFSNVLTESEFAALQRQLQRCWSIQAGANYAENLAVEVRIIVTPDKKVTSATVVDQWRYGQDSYYRAAADSAIRALHSPQCETLDLPEGKYNVWKDMIINFDPKEMLQ